MWSAHSLQHQATGRSSSACVHLGIQHRPHVCVYHVLTEAMLTAQPQQPVILALLPANPPITCHGVQVSNYAKPGKRCRHNAVYWSLQPYYGWGLGAASYLGRRRLSRPASMKQYQVLVEAAASPAMGVLGVGDDHAATPTEVRDGEEGRHHLGCIRRGSMHMACTCKDCSYIYRQLLSLLRLCSRCAPGLLVYHRQPPQQPSLAADAMSSLQSHASCRLICRWFSI
jgi:hypothetical protein